MRKRLVASAFLKFEFGQNVAISLVRFSQRRSGVCDNSSRRWSITGELWGGGGGHKEKGTSRRG
eukprot:8801082-Pyramimonas_sp.AAC.1